MLGLSGRGLGGGCLVVGEHTLSGRGLGGGCLTCVGGGTDECWG